MTNKFLFVVWSKEREEKRLRRSTQTAPFSVDPYAMYKGYGYGYNAAPFSSPYGLDPLLGMPVRPHRLNMARGESNICCIRGGGVVEVLMA